MLYLRSDSNRSGASIAVIALDLGLVSSDILTGVSSSKALKRFPWHWLRLEKRPAIP
ncbi:hypothetical protein KCP70_04280 [Salmonella enterica subsp. enterica]|nr:hypothetical protein KCP70_04280 [Salmonella enterica subsp. enterica]